MEGIGSVIAHTLVLAVFAVAWLLGVMFWEPMPELGLQPTGFIGIVGHLGVGAGIGLVFLVLVYIFGLGEVLLEGLAVLIEGLIRVAFRL